jgi:TolA-binding protein
MCLIRHRHARTVEELWIVSKPEGQCGRSAVRLKCCPCQQKSFWSANSFDQHHTVAMLHDIQRQLSEQAHQLSEQAHKMDCRAHKMDCQQIAKLRLALERAETILAKSEEEKDIWRRRSEAYRKQVSSQNEIADLTCTDPARGTLCT